MSPHRSVAANRRVDAKRGERFRDLKDGKFALGGAKPANPSGGHKSFGHPIGATGGRMIYECTQQLQGRAGERQVKDAEIGLAHNLGRPPSRGRLRDDRRQFAVGLWLLVIPAVLSLA